MQLSEVNNNMKKKVLLLVYFFVFLAVLSDVPIIIIYTLTKSSILTHIFLYGSEFTILIISAYLFIKPSDVKFPTFLYIYCIYILAVTMVSLFFYDTYDVLRNSRKLLAILPPVIFGYYFGFYLWEEREKYIKKLIIFLTIMSIVGLVEFVWWGLSKQTLISFCSKFLNYNSYYYYIRHSSNITQTGIMTSGIRPEGMIIPGISKRLTGFYFEPFAAGFNTSLAIILILYCRIAGFGRMKHEYLILGINISALILTTSRSSYLLLSVFLLSFFYYKGKLHPAMLLCLLALLYEPFRIFCLDSIRNLGGEVHQRAALGLPQFILSHINSIDFIWGGGLGSMEKTIFEIESGYGAIFSQLGIIGLVSIVSLYLCMTVGFLPSTQDKFYILGILGSIILLLFFAGYLFGYKTFGLLHLVLGSISSRYRSRILPIQAGLYHLPNCIYAKTL